MAVCSPPEQGRYGAQTECWACTRKTGNVVKNAIFDFSASLFYSPRAVLVKRKSTASSVFMGVKGRNDLAWTLAIQHFRCVVSNVMCVRVMQISSVFLCLIGKVYWLIITRSPYMLKPVVEIDLHEIYCLKQFHCLKHIQLISTLTD